MNIIFFEEDRAIFFPLTFTRPIADLRIGILTIREKWELMLGVTSSTKTVEYLSKKFPSKYTEKNIWINSTMCPNTTLINEITQLKNQEVLMFGDNIVAANTGKKNTFETKSIKSYSRKETTTTPFQIKKITDIFSKNDQAIQDDFNLLTKGKSSQAISSTNTVIGNNIFIEEGAKIEASVLNSTTGPIYIGKNAEIMEGSLIRGPFALCDYATLKLGTKIYGATTIGPHSKVGGEVTNSVIIGYSNKGHDGFLGNSILGEWCNLGADTNNSNLKNNYSEVSLWDYRTEKEEKTGLQFCGLIMGDHSKCGINTMFNTGTVVGVFANIFGGNFPPKFIPSFSWGGSNGLETYRTDKAFEVAKEVMHRRSVNFTPTEENILSEIFNITKKYRK